MKRSWAWVTFFSLVCMAAMAGCSAGDPPLAELPTHALDLSSAPPSVASTAAPISSEPAQKPQADLAAPGYRQWWYIVVHHSGSEKGNAETFDVMHRKRGWDELGYHFVIDNGQGGTDGFIEVGPRWKAQKWGAHCGGTPNNEYNTHGIGICLVGNFTTHMPTQAQLVSLRQLVAYLAQTNQIPPENIIGHRDVPGAKTTCPGDMLHTYIFASLCDLGYKP